MFLLLKRLRRPTLYRKGGCLFSRLNWRYRIFAYTFADSICLYPDRGPAINPDDPEAGISSKTGSTTRK